MIFRLKHLLFLGVLLCAPFAAPPTACAGDAKEDEPFFFTADQVEYNEETSVITASGNVEITNSLRVVQADTIIYEQNTKRVYAQGNVAVIEPSGDVIFSDYTELTDDLSEGFARHVSMLLSDNSRMAGRAAERYTMPDGSTQLNLAEATYSPCNLCEGVKNPDDAALWQMRAKRVNHDTKTKDVTYEDAWLEFYGTPVLYMPQFSHPDPSVKRRSGFLTPGFGMGSDIGAFTRTPYYIDIATDLDATITPTFSQNDGLQMAAEMRKRWRDGSLRLDGSIVQAELIEETGVVRDNATRGHVRGEARFDLNEYWRMGGDLYLSTDKTYLDRYRIPSPDVLINRGFVEGFDKRDYAVIEGYYFQDTRPDRLLGVRESQPYVLPRIRGESYGKAAGVPVLGGRWRAGGEMMALDRSGNNLDTRRLSLDGDWERTDIFPIGLVSTVETAARADGYYTSNYVDPITGVRGPDTERMRLYPSTALTLRYPLARQFGSVQQTLEPLVQGMVAPITDDDNIPNEDSTDFELDHSNLFAVNRFTGVDRLEGGPRITYGMRTGVFGTGGGSASAFLGQSHRFRQEANFPNGSGLNKQTSDYVGRVQIDPAYWLSFDYNYRLDQASFQPRKHDARISVGSKPVWLYTNYLFLDEQAGSLGGVSREEIYSSLNYKFAEYWTAYVSQQRTFKPTPQPLYSSIGFNYADECFDLGFSGTRNHTNRTGLNTGDSFFVRLILKNIGGIETPVSGGGGAGF